MLTDSVSIYFESVDKKLVIKTKTYLSIREAVELIKTLENWLKEQLDDQDESIGLIARP